jgi:hypothetical protein
VQGTRCKQTWKIPTIEYEPWSPKAHVHILDNELAKLAKAEEPGTIDFYTDGSVRNGQAGRGIWTLAWEVSRTIRRAEETNVHLIEPEAIWMAIKDLAHKNNRLVKSRAFSDSQSAPRSIQSAKIHDSLGLVMRTREKIRRLQSVQGLSDLHPPYITKIDDCDWLESLLSEDSLK